MQYLTLGKNQTNCISRCAGYLCNASGRVQHHADKPSAQEYSLTWMCWCYMVVFSMLNHKLISPLEIHDRTALWYTGVKCRVNHMCTETCSALWVFYSSAVTEAVRVGHRRQICKLAVNGFSILELNYAICLLGLVLPLLGGFKLQNAPWTPRSFFQRQGGRHTKKRPQTPKQQIRADWSWNRKLFVESWL